MKPSQIIRLDFRTKKKEIEVDLEGQAELSTRGRANFGETNRTATHILVSCNVVQVWSSIVP